MISLPVWTPSSTAPRSTTNAVLTHTGASTGFITTRGFRDLLALRRGMKTGERYDLEQAPPPTLVERALTLTVTERVDAKGRILTPLVEDDVRAAAEVLRSAGVEAVAVSYLWSFLNPEHELRTREILQETLPGVYISLSSEVLPQIRVYERNSTTALNSYTGPPLARYLDNLEARLGENGFPRRVEHHAVQRRLHVSEGHQPVCRQYPAVRPRRWSRRRNALRAHPRL